jgi:hypothetical protein
MLWETADKDILSNIENKVKPVLVKIKGVKNNGNYARTLEVVNSLR